MMRQASRKGVCADAKFLGYPTELVFARQGAMHDLALSNTNRERVHQSALSDF